MAEKLGHQIDMSGMDVIRCLLDPTPACDYRLLELLLATPWPANRRMLENFRDFLVSRITTGETILYLGHSVPGWTLPPAVRRALGGTGTRDQKKYQADSILNRGLYRAFVDGAVCKRILLPLIRSEFEAATTPPLNKLSKETLSEVLGDLMKSEHVLPALVDDQAELFPTTVRDYVARYDAVVLVDNVLLCKQFRRRRAWLVFDRAQSSEVAGYIDRERQFLADLRQWVVRSERRREVHDAFNRLGG